jgi:hypothetical protein
MDAKPCNESKQSQDDYCRGCVHADSCNVMLKDGEECGDRMDSGQTDAEADEERAAFENRVLDHLAHWPGVEAVDLDAEHLVRVERLDGKETIFLERDHAEYFVSRHRIPGPDNCGWTFAPADGLSHDD